MTIALPRSGPYFESFASFGHAFSLSVIVSLVFCTLLIAPFCILRFFVSGLVLRSLLFAILSGVGSFYVLAQLSNLLERMSANPSFTHYKVGYVISFALLFGFVLIIAGAVYSVSRRYLPDKPLYSFLTGTCLALPFVLGLSMLLVWAQTHAELGGLTSRALLTLCLAYLVAVAVTLIVANTQFFQRHCIWPLTVLLIVSCSAPFIAINMPVHLSAERGPVGQDDGQPKHIVLIIVDTLRADALSCYGSDRISTPNIDAIAEDSWVFRNAVSPSSWTLPAVASIMTGVSPLVHKAKKPNTPLSGQFQTLGEYLRDAQYQTAAIGANAMIRKEMGIAQGFDDYLWFSDATSQGPPTPLSKIGVGLLGYDDKLETGAAAFLTTRAIRWQNRVKGMPSFLWLHYFDPHAPYAPPAEFAPQGTNRLPAFRNTTAVRQGQMGVDPDEREWIRSLYDAEVRYVDSQVGVFMEALKQMGIYEESLIILTSDHGEEFWEHGGFDHGHTMYRELLSVPLIVKLPYSASKGTLETLVGTESITPTVLQLCGINFDPDSMTSPSLAALLAGQASGFEASPVVSAGTLFFEEKEAVTTLEYKLIKAVQSDKVELFDLKTDPMEQNPLKPVDPVRLQELRASIQNIKTRAQSIRETIGMKAVESVELDAAAEEQLRALGYIN